MNCPKCGKENMNDSNNCFFCNTPFRETNTENEPVTVSVSKLAILAIALSFCCMLFTMPVIFAINNPQIISPKVTWVTQLFSISHILFVISIIVGFVSLIRIEKSGGRITGRNFAVAGILLPVFIGLLPILYAMATYPRCVAFRMVCGTNLSGIGKAMLIYANDYHDEFPRAAGRNGIWKTQIDYDAQLRNEAYGMDNFGTGGGATISASLYLLVKYAEVTPKSFICNRTKDGGDKGVSEYKPPKNTDLTNLWDFGPEPWKHCSYAYHIPYSSYTLTTSSEPGMAVAADRNPWMPSVGWKPKKFVEFNPDGDRRLTNNGNTPCHQDEGQNVLYLDTHVNFENTSSCGVNEDNIYTSWNGTDIRKGKQPVFGSEPEDRKDSLLVNDPPIKNP